MSHVVSTIDYPLIRNAHEKEDRKYSLSKLVAPESSADKIAFDLHAGRSTNAVLIALLICTAALTRVEFAEMTCV